MNTPAAKNSARTDKARTRGAVIYTRVSTGEQEKHGTSPETQLAACRAKALALGLPIVAEYHDGGVSGGFLLARPGMQAAMADIKAGRANALICPNISRYSRDREHQSRIKREVRAAGGGLVFCDMHFEDNPQGDFAFNMMGDVADYEKAIIKERTYGGHVSRAGQGVQSARVTSPFGYVIPKAADILRGTYPAAQLGKYLIVEEKAAIVADLFAKYDAGTHSLNDLSKMLNRSGLPTPGGGKMWRASNVRYIFTNPVYKGLATFGRFDHTTDEMRFLQNDTRTGLPLTSAKSMSPADPETWITWEVPAVVGEDVWERVNERLRLNKKLKSGNRQQVRMLSGRVFCPECGAGMFCASQTHKASKKDASVIFTYPRRYQCGHYRRTLMDKGAAECQPTGFYVNEVEEAVIQALLDACQRPESIREAIAAYQAAQEAPKPATDARQELAQVDKALRSLEERSAATVKAQIAGVMAGADPGAYNSVFADMAAERKDLEDRRGVLARMLTAKTASPKERAGDKPDFTVLLEKARLVLTAEDVAGEVKRNIVGTVIEKVICLKASDKSAGAEIIFLPGVFDGAFPNGFPDTLQTPREVPEMSRFRAGKRQGSGFVPIGNSESTAPCP